MRQFLHGVATNVTCRFILSDLPQQRSELFGKLTAITDEFRSRINLGKEAAFDTVRITDVLQRLAPCMAYSFTQQENATLAAGPPSLPKRSHAAIEMKPAASTQWQSIYG
ncbi:hypothetical protein [Phaeobacter sp. J2-8]|uniref:hypothetical protein n=1 Tax=Phaeobacter sp. J2-8 TaxID=2931394 RepID=UPI001FD014DF|nr:hypothetical protein [Phaeobacter sp. J2-8]MCJ7871169.1 hypothetical protein [Phaeobacter sp. J2-8]